MSVVPQSTRTLITLPLSVWLGLSLFVGSLHAVAGLNYYRQMPKIPQPTPIPVVGPPTPSDSPPVPKPTQTPTPPPRSEFAREPAPKKLRHRLILLVLASMQLQKNPGVLPQNLKNLQSRYVDDLLKREIYVVGADRFAAWNSPSVSPCPLVTPFADERYDLATAAGFAAAERLVPPEFRNDYACVLIWHSPVNPDSHSQAFPNTEAWYGRDYLIWSARSSEISRKKMRARFPDRNAGLDADAGSDPDELANYVQSMLKKPTSLFP